MSEMSFNQSSLSRSDQVCSGSGSGSESEVSTNGNKNNVIRA